MQRERQGRMQDATHYEVLGVPSTAGPDEIRRAFRRQARRLHPDMNHGADAGQYLAVAEAYRVLSDAASRRSYDASLRGASRSRTGAPSSNGFGRVFTSPLRPEPDPEPVWPHPREPMPAPRGTAHVSGPAPARWWFPVLGVVVIVGGIWVPDVLLQLVTVVLGAAFLAVFLRRRSRLVPAVPVGEARATRVWGEPGAGCAAGSEPVRGSAEVCQDTARVIAAELGDLPGLRVFHGVLIPGADVVDHVLVCGGKVALVASRETSADALGWWRGRISGGATAAPPVDLATVRRATEALGDVIVAGWVLVYGAETNVSNRGAPPYVRLQTAGRGVGEIRNWLLADNNARLVDRVLLHRVTELLVPGEVSAR